MHNFQKLIFWQKSMDLAKDVYLLCQKLPSDEKFGLVSQMKRCAISIPSNISEGVGRNGNKEFNHFLGISIGSSCELQTQLILSEKLGLVENQSIEELLASVNEIQKMIFTFMKTLN
ncbi:four helix bundle protein [Halpernia humi]|uniref:Four helix bundle protein n=1 Tax=Halpernia humi TaxID=493375 RepID=A0A1H5Z818_9FLAO|nr:four helix bundle protein [Halpernia humi]SEG32663.1 four helix bundle protein [Halpernia humi]